MSGFANPSYHDGPRELYPAMRSSARLTESNVRTEPTEMPDGALPGDAMPAYPISPVALFRPKLPADTTTTMPAREACSTACTRGSVAADSKIGWPSDRLMTSMLSASLLTIANSIARIASSVDPWPCPLRTFRPIRRASGATPT